MPSILYDDRAILICCKPAGIVSEPDAGRGLPDRLADQLRTAGKRDFLAGVHRLDRNVGGLMVFSRRKDVTGRLIEQLRTRAVEKEYLAILRGAPSAPDGTLEDLLFHDARCNKTFVVQRMRRGVRDARLDYRTLAQMSFEGQTLTLVRVRLHTGRTHQIRVQFASRGVPLLGDLRYGSRDRRCDVSLWSFHLALRHPDRGERLEFTCPPPAQYPWTLFSDAIEKEAAT